MQHVHNHLFRDRSHTTTRQRWCALPAAPSTLLSADAPWPYGGRIYRQDSLFGSSLGGVHRHGQTATGTRRAGWELSQMPCANSQAMLMYGVHWGCIWQESVIRDAVGQACGVHAADLEAQLETGTPPNCSYCQVCVTTLRLSSLAPWRRREASPAPSRLQACTDLCGTPWPRMVRLPLLSRHACATLPCMTKRVHVDAIPAPWLHRSAAEHAHCQTRTRLDCLL